LGGSRPSWIRAIGWARLTAMILTSLPALIVVLARADSHRVRERVCSVDDPVVCNFMMGSDWEPWETGRTWSWMRRGLIFVVRSELGLLTLIMDQGDSQSIAIRSFRYGGFRFSQRRASGPVGTPGDFHELTVPFWALFLLTATPAALLMNRACRTVRWLRAGRCLCCGYDLTGNTSGICPECGTPMREDSRRHQQNTTSGDVRYPTST